LSIDDTVVTIVRLNHAFDEKAFRVRDDLNTTLDKALQPLREEVAALRSWLGGTSLILEHAEKLVARLDIASSVFVPFSCSHAEGPSPPVAVRPQSTAMGPMVIQSLVTLHGEDESCNMGTPIAKDANIKLVN
jgi:hypothetical protein